MSARASIRILAFSEGELLVSWREAGRCCYAEQQWHLRTVPIGGTCALSGRPFEPGTEAFVPRERVALNHDAAILADVAMAGNENVGDFEFIHADRAAGKRKTGSASTKRAPSSKKKTAPRKAAKPSSPQKVSKPRAKTASSTTVQ